MTHFFRRVALPESGYARIGGKPAPELAIQLPGVVLGGDGVFEEDSDRLTIGHIASSLVEKVVMKFYHEI